MKLWSPASSAWNMFATTFITNFYKTQKVYTQEEEELRAMILSSLPKRVFKAVNVKLACKLTTNNEFCAAAKSMAKGKAPGLDGVVIEFYSFFFGITKSLV